MGKEYDIAIIGAGPGGYVAAIRAAQLDLNVAVIEKDSPGGVCLNWGCIPSKNLIHQAEQYSALKEMEAVGVTVDRSSLDYSLVQGNSRQVVKKLTNGVSGLLKKNGVTYIKGEARFTGEHQLIVDNHRIIHARNIIVATGSRPMQASGFETDEQQVLSSSGMLAMTRLPDSMIILGAGAIGCEFAYVLNSFGVKVSLVEVLDHILPTEDFETSAMLADCLSDAGVDIRHSTRAIHLSRTKTKVKVTLESADGKQETIGADKVLVVFGRVPNTENLGLEELGVDLTDRGYVETVDFCETSVSGIYAIGDITTSPALAHVASREGELVVEHIAGYGSTTTLIDPQLVPSAIYCEPQVAGFGLREDEAIKTGVKFKKSTFRYSGNGKAIAIGREEGLVKILCDLETDELLGAHIVGHNATELIHELLLCKSAELLPEDIFQTIHAHPTVSEVIMETMRGVDGKPVHA